MRADFGFTLYKDTLITDEAELILERDPLKLDDILLSVYKYQFISDNLRRYKINKNYDCTIVIISQRISSIKHSDNILVLDEGKVVGYGTHEHLLKTSQIYNEIYQSQMGGGIDE